MEITLNHTIIPSNDHVKSAQFYARIFGFEFVREWHRFAVVKVNESLTLDFMNKDGFHSMHYAFKVSDEQFDTIFQKLESESIVYGSGPSSLDDGTINTLYGGRGLYFRDLDGHVLEIITTNYILD